MKKFLSLTVFTFILCFSFILGNSSVFANEGVLELPRDIEGSSEDLKSSTIIDDKLKRLGFMDSTISKMPLEQKKHIISNNPIEIIYGTTQEFYFDEVGELKELVINPDEYSAFKTIPTTDLKLTPSVIDWGRISGRQTYTLMLEWDWLKTTAFAWTDTVGLSYNDEFRTRISNNGAYSCTAAAWREGSTLPPTSTNCGGRPADLSTGGAYWHYDMKLGDINYGLVSMDIETVATNKSGNMITLGKYIHKTGFPGGIGFQIGFVSLNPVGSGYDEAAVQGVLPYKY